MADSDRYDIGLLQRFDRYHTVFAKQEVTELLILGHPSRAAKPCRVLPDFADHARSLYLQTPTPGRVRVAGRLDMVQASTLAFELELPTGERIRGVWKGEELETLRTLLNSDVVASGTAVYRPSGGVLRVDADALSPQGPADAFFAVAPKPSAARHDLKSLLGPQSNKGGVAKMWERLTADETDEEFLAALSNLD